MSENPESFKEYKNKNELIAKLRDYIVALDCPVTLHDLYETIGLLLPYNRNSFNRIMAKVEKAPEISSKTITVIQYRIKYFYKSTFDEELIQAFESNLTEPYKVENKSIRASYLESLHTMLLQKLQNNNEIELPTSRRQLAIWATDTVGIHSKSYWLEHVITEEFAKSHPEFIKRK